MMSEVYGICTQKHSVNSAFPDPSSEVLTWESKTVRVSIYSKSPTEERQQVRRLSLNENLKSVVIVSRACVECNAQARLLCHVLILEAWSKRLPQALGPHDGGLENCRVFARAFFQGMRRRIG